MNNEGVVNEVLANEVVDTNTATDSVPDADALPVGGKSKDDDNQYIKPSVIDGNYPFSVITK